jgi:apolipoprotein N-acyltransferase
MLVPASDWRAIAKLHQQIAEFRAIESGVAMFRITRWGGSGAVDPYGRRLAVMNDFATRDNVIVAHVPAAAGVRTVYALVGDLFAWLCVAGLVGVSAWGVWRLRQTK